jgi:hypothetical protein
MIKTMLSFHLLGFTLFSALILIISCRSRSPDFVFMAARMAGPRDSRASLCTWGTVTSQLPTQFVPPINQPTLERIP